MVIEFAIPGLRIRSAQNLREFWATKARRVAQERRCVAAGIMAAGASRTLRAMADKGPPFSLALTRISPRSVDPDNCVSGFKATVDQLALTLRVDDADPEVLRVLYLQEKGPIGVRIKVNCG